MRHSQPKAVHRRSIMLICALIFLRIFIVGLASAEEAPQKLRVAFPSVDGFSETDANGVRHGIVVDFLEEIAKYTGWEYEYIDATANNMINDFLAGKFDLMGGTYYSEGLEQYFAYPDYSCGSTKSVLLCRKGDYSLSNAEKRTFNGKTIGVYERATENIRRLKEFLSINGLNCELKYYKYEQLSADGNLYEYLMNGEVDMLLGNRVESSDELRVIASFDSQPHYIVTNVGNQQVAAGLNMALEKIYDSSPNFGEECYINNFSQIGNWNILLNDAETAYIEQNPTLRVAVVNDWHPLSCNDSIHNGITMDTLTSVAEFTGLEFLYVYSDSYMDAIRKVQNGEVDMLGFFLGNAADANELGLVQTREYASLVNIIARNKATSYPAPGLTAAVVKGTALPPSIKAAKIQYYESTIDALRAVNQRQADFTCGVSLNLELEIQKSMLANIMPVTIMDNEATINFALAKPANITLLTILDKAINNISSEEKAAILNTNMVSIGANNMSITALIYANPMLFLAVIIVVFAIVIIVTIVILRANLRSAKIQIELEKAEAQNRAKGEFLSRMSHEIRTPMNAVVGLTELTSMLDGLPEKARTNLEKIRASSQYLLRLINDILDMSRIENGMLNITNAPFSVSRMLSEVHSMMSSKAESRNIELALETDKVTHDMLVGDSLRIKQVLLNLLSNAVKFTPSGGNVRLCAAQLNAGDETVSMRFSVIDNGIGIPKAAQARIFEAFEQYGANYSKSQGTGLGLAISRNIVQLMGGTLTLKSEVNNGCEFSFTIALPINKQHEDTNHDIGQNILEGINILLAEDNELNAEIAIDILKLKGASVEWGENGLKVLERFANSYLGEFQIIIMDVRMPEMNGLEATQAIRRLAREDAASIPIIAMTANSFQEDKRAAMDAGMSGFVSKPLDINHLYHVISRALNGESGWE